MAVWAMGSAAKKPERIAGLMLELGLAKHPAADRDHRVGGQHEGLPEPEPS